MIYWQTDNNDVLLSGPHEASPPADYADNKHWPSFGG